MKKKISLIVLCVMILFSVCGCGTNNKKEKSNYDITIKFDKSYRYDGNDKIVVGSIKNHTNNVYDNIEISFVYYNREGNRAGFCRTPINWYGNYTLYANSGKDFELFCTGMTSNMYNFEFESFKSNDEEIDLKIELIEE